MGRDEKKVNSGFSFFDSGDGIAAGLLDFASRNPAYSFSRWRREIAGPGVTAYCGVADGRGVDLDWLDRALYRLLQRTKPMSASESAAQWIGVLVQQPSPGPATLPDSGHWRLVGYRHTAVTGIEKQMWRVLIIPV